MEVIRCKCTCMYPSDMDKCPTCGASTSRNKERECNIFSNQSSTHTNPDGWTAVSGGTTYKYTDVDYKRSEKLKINKKLKTRTCNACDGVISIRAEICPHCGDPTGVHLCPKCNSVNTKVITGTSKAASIFLWGAFAANKVVSKYECKDCGHKF